MRRDLGKQAEGLAPHRGPARADGDSRMYRYDEFDAAFVAERVGAVPRAGRAAASPAS